MLRFAKWHIWLGWLVGFPLLMWTITGLIMVARPIDEVRGTHLRAEPAALELGRYTLPAFDAPVTRVELIQQTIGPVWVVSMADGGRYRYDARTGGVLPPVIASEAREIAAASFAGDAELESVRYFPGDSAPLDLRSPVNSWQLHFSDDTNLYVEAATGQLLAVRSSWWRVFDFAWGLHIMDLQTREDTHHPILIAFAVLSVLGTLLGCILMFRRRKARVRA